MIFRLVFEQLEHAAKRVSQPIDSKTLLKMEPFELCTNISDMRAKNAQHAYKRFLKF